MRSTCRQDLPLLALSATIDVDLTLVINICHLSKTVKIISTCSDRSNLYLEVKFAPKQDGIQCLSWIIPMLREENSSKIVIFCRSVTLAGFVYSQLLRLFRREEIADPKSIVGLYHSETLEKHKLTVTECLTCNHSSMKVVVATSALGCAINMKNVRHVVHFGPAFHVVDYCQQIGRAGREGEDLCHAVLYNFPNQQIYEKVHH